MRSKYFYIIRRWYIVQYIPDTPYALQYIQFEKEAQ